MLHAKSIDEVVEWMKRFPLDKNRGELEIRKRGSERDARAPREARSDVFLISCATAAARRSRRYRRRRRRRPGSMSGQTSTLH
jgi:hypothetical protein